MTKPADRTSSVDGASGTPAPDAPTDTASSPDVPSSGAGDSAHPGTDSLVGHRVRSREGRPLGRLTKVLPCPDGDNPASTGTGPAPEPTRSPR